MTREEAIRLLSGLMFKGKLKEALDMAIKALVQAPTTKNDLGVDAVSRQEVLELIADYDLSMGQVVRGIHALPSVTLQEPKTFKWCTDCREYDQEKHCCHRWSKAIRDTVEEMKQEYIEREVLDKIRAEIAEEKEHAYADFERYKVEYLGQDWEDALDSLPQDDFRYGLERAIELIDKYKAETEVEGGNDKILY